MPIYEYVCSKCGKVSDVIQKMSDPTPEKCGNCGEAGTLSRVVSRTSFVLKGGGWYSDLYGSSKKDGGSASSSSSPAAASSTSEASAPAATPAAAPATPSTSTPSSSGEAKK